MVTSRACTPLALLAVAGHLCLSANQTVKSGCSNPTGVCDTNSLLQHREARPQLVTFSEAVRSTTLHVRTVTLGHFLNYNVLNARYTERVDKDVNGVETYWADPNKSWDAAIYYCARADQWMIAGRKPLEKYQVTKNAVCPWTAKAPAGVDIRKEPISKGWTEYDAANGLAVRALAGVVLLSSEKKLHEPIVPEVTVTIPYCLVGDSVTTECTDILLVRNLSKGVMSRNIPKRAWEGSGLSEPDQWVLHKVDDDLFSPSRLQDAMMNQENFTISFFANVDFWSLDKMNENKCGQIFYWHGARNQGRLCNNCWAQLVATLVEFHLCLENPEWKGHNAYLSSSYITSCAQPAWSGKDGCESGGYILEGLRWVGENGVPTGGNGDNRKTCVPSFTSGHRFEEYRKSHIDEKSGLLEPPECPAACSNSEYPRKLQKDLFKPEGLKRSWSTTAVETARHFIREFGPIGMTFPIHSNFAAFGDFMHAETEIYHPEGEFEENHAVLAVGFGETSDGPYIKAINSWGNQWGFFGFFKIAPEAVGQFIIPGDTHGQGGYPLPLPNAHTYTTMLWTAAFKQKILNKQFVDDYSPKIGGQKTFWDVSGNTFVYFCKGTMQWGITTESNLAKIQAGECWFHARSKDDCRVRELGEKGLYVKGNTGGLTINGTLINTSYDATAACTWMEWADGTFIDSIGTITDVKHE